ncbi:hypothetical protein Bbelb_249640 [Branchiostoma belcheri]|nr:hypothetical protein Bbelb_249640 [Branchiostoma belcheri]
MPVWTGGSATNMVLLCKTEMLCLGLVMFCGLCNSHALDSERKQRLPLPGATDTEPLPAARHLLTFEVSPLERLEGLMLRGGRHRRSTLIEFTVPLAIRITGRGTITVDINAINLDDGSELIFRIDTARTNINGTATLQPKTCDSSTNSGCVSLSYKTASGSLTGTDRIYIIVEAKNKPSNYVEVVFMVTTTNPGGVLGSTYVGQAPYSPADEGQNWQIAAALLAASVFILICAIINIWCCMEFDRKPEEDRGDTATEISRDCGELLTPKTLGKLHPPGSDTMLPGSLLKKNLGRKYRDWDESKEQKEWRGSKGRENATSGPRNSRVWRLDRAGLLTPKAARRHTMLLDIAYVIFPTPSRMDDSRIPRQLLYGELKLGSRRRGRPKLRYKDVLKNNLQWCGIKPSEFEAAAADRPAWRALVTKATSAFEEERRRRLEAVREKRHRTTTTTSTTEYQCSSLWAKKSPEDPPHLTGCAQKSSSETMDNQRRERVTSCREKESDTRVTRAQRTVQNRSRVTNIRILSTVGLPQQEMKETPRRMTSSYNPHYRQRYDSIWRREAVRDGRADGSLTPMPYYGERRNSTRLTAFVDPESERRTPQPSVVQGSFYSPSKRGSTAGTMYDRRTSTAIPQPQVMTINYDPIPEDDSPGYTPPPVTSRSVRTSWTGQQNHEAINSPVGRPRSNSLSPNGRRHRRVSALSADIEAFKKVPWDQISTGRSSLTSGYV